MQTSTVSIRRQTSDANHMVPWVRPFKRPHKTREISSSLSQNWTATNEKNLKSKIRCRTLFVTINKVTRCLRPKLSCCEFRGAMSVRLKKITNRTHSYILHAFSLHSPQSNGVVFYFLPIFHMGKENI